MPISPITLTFLPNCYWLFWNVMDSHCVPNTSLCLLRRSELNLKTVSYNLKKENSCCGHLSFFQKNSVSLRLSCYVITFPCYYSASFPSSNSERLFYKVFKVEVTKKNPKQNQKPKNKNGDLRDFMVKLIRGKSISVKRRF